MKFSILGIPSSAGANMPGSEFAPDHLRKCGLVSNLVSRGAEVVDYGDCELNPYKADPDHRSPKNLSGTAKAAKDVMTRAEEIFSKGGKILLFGGDCTVTVGLVAAAAKTHSDLGLAYLDSSPDLNTPARSAEGIMDSMGLAHMLGFVDNELSRVGDRFPLIQPEKVSAFGYHPDRTQDVEHEFLEANAIHQFPGTEVSGNIREKATEARTRLEKSCQNYIIHFDVDVIDFCLFPVADMPVYRGFGLKFDEALAALRIFAESKKCIAVSFTEFNPDRDKNHELGKQYVKALGAALVHEKE